MIQVFLKKTSFLALPVIALVLLALLISFTSSTHIASAHTATPAKPDNPHSGAGAQVYVHIATTSNTTANWTELDNKSSNNHPNAVVIVTPNSAAGIGGTVDDHPVGVWYDAMTGKWAIFNEDKAVMPHGAAFNVFAVPGSIQGNVEAAITDVASTANSKGNWTYLDNPITNNNPNIFLNVTSNWNPAGKGGVYNAHPLGVWYDSQVGKWAIFNEGSMDAIPSGAAFNMFIDTPVVNGLFLHQATAANTTGNHTTLDSSFTNGNSAALLFATPNFNPQGQSGTYEAHNLSVDYRNNHWLILDLDGSLPNTAAFNILKSDHFTS